MPREPGRPRFLVWFSRFESSQCASLGTYDSSNDYLRSLRWFSSRSSGHAIIPVLTPRLESIGTGQSGRGVEITVFRRLPRGLGEPSNYIAGNSIDVSRRFLAFETVKETEGDRRVPKGTEGDRRSKETGGRLSLLTPRDALLSSKHGETSRSVSPRCFIDHFHALHRFFPFLRDLGTSWSA